MTRLFSSLWKDFELLFDLIERLASWQLYGYVYEELVSSHYKEFLLNAHVQVRTCLTDTCSIECLWTLPYCLYLTLSFKGLKCRQITKSFSLLGFEGSMIVVCCLSRTSICYEAQELLQQNQLFHLFWSVSKNRWSLVMKV